MLIACASLALLLGFSPKGDWWPMGWLNDHRAAIALGAVVGTPPALLLDLVGRRLGREWTSPVIIGVGFAIVAVGAEAEKLESAVKTAEGDSTVLAGVLTLVAIAAVVGALLLFLFPNMIPGESAETLKERTTARRQSMFLYAPLAAIALAVVAKILL